MFPIQAGIPCVWMNDSQRILLEHFDAIHSSPFYLYHSALPFCPSSSWLCECYTAELSQEVRVVGGLQAEWGMCSRTVLLESNPSTLSFWNNTIAVGSAHEDIFILDAITGSQTAVFPGHTDQVISLIFSQDGTSLVSGSFDKTVKLWDVQTGGVVKTFCGHTNWIYSVSISADYTTIASGSEDMTFRLWDIRTGACHKIIEQGNRVNCISFSPKNPKTLISVSGETVQQWDVDGHKVGPAYDGRQIAFSPDGTQFILHTGDGNIAIQNTNSGVAVAKFDTADSYYIYSCFSPDGRFIAIAASNKVCVWDITGPDPHLVESSVGHTTSSITSFAFFSPYTIILASNDRLVKFWQIGASSANPAVTNPMSTPLTLASTKSITLKARNGPIIPSNLPDGVVKTWGISTGPCNGSLKVPAEDSYQNNLQLNVNKLIFVWYANMRINIWDAEKGELLQTIDVSGGHVMDLRVSGDGSKVFCLYEGFIQAWDIRTREAAGGVELQGAAEIVALDGSTVWVNSWVGAGAGAVNYQDQGWDFGVPDSSPVKLSHELPDMLYLNETKQWETETSRMKDVVTGKVVFQLPGRFGKTTHVQLGGQYLVASFKSGEVLILDFSHVFP